MIPAGCKPGVFVVVLRALVALILLSLSFFGYFILRARPVCARVFDTYPPATKNKPSTILWWGVGLHYTTVTLPPAGCKKRRNVPYDM